MLAAIRRAASLLSDARDDFAKLKNILENEQDAPS